jgi:hypothetical protein
LRHPLLLAVSLAALQGRLELLPIGARIAAGMLLLMVVVGWAAAFNMALGRAEIALELRRPARRKKSKRRFGLKHLALLLVALLPGGLVGTAAVALILGKKDWRRDAVYIQLAALPVGLALAGLSWPRFPWPELADHIFLTGALGLTYALLQFWTTLKLLRQTWGEPEMSVPWWPACALWMQTLVLAAGAWLLAM